MARGNAPLLAFNRGEVSKLALGRVDVDRLRLSAECQVNWEPRVLGPMSLRRGFEKIQEIPTDQPTQLIPFVFSKTDTALLVATANELRILINGEFVTRAAVSTTIADPFFNGTGGWDTSASSAGTQLLLAGALRMKSPPIGGVARSKQHLTVLSQDQGVEHGLRIQVDLGPVTLRVGSADGLDDLIASTDIDVGIHSLAFTPSSDVYIELSTSDAWTKQVFECSIESAGVVALSTTWGASDLANLRWDQSADVIFVACKDQQQRKIERRSTNGWSFVLYRSANGPFLTAPSSPALLTPGDMTGDTTLTSDRPFFQQDHVGAIFQLLTRGQINRTILGALNAATEAVRVSGVGIAARNYVWETTGGWVGTLTLERSFDGPDSGFTVVASESINGNLNSLTGTDYTTTPITYGTPPLDNVIAWERVRFTAYTSGTAGLESTYLAGGDFGICRVTDYVSPTQVNVQVLSPFSSTQGTNDWLESEWSDFRGWPTSVAFHEGRLWWFGRDRIWGSQSDNYVGYAVQDTQGQSLGDAGAILEAFGAGAVDTVNWGVALTRLLCGREQSIASIRSSSFDQPLTPTDFSVKDCATQGAARLPALKIDKRAVFVQQSGARVYELAFDAQAMDYSSHDLTRLNIDIGAPGFANLAVARQPDTMLYLVRSDGQCAVLLYDVDDDVIAWWRIQTAGVIEAVAVLPPLDTTGATLDDQVFFVVRRVINNVTRRFIERLAPRAKCVGGDINQQLDCFSSYQGAAISTMTLSWLPNTEVAIWADGAPRGTATSDSSGIVVLGGNYTNVVVGLAGALVSRTSATLTSTLGVGAQYSGYPAEVWADVGGTGNLVHLGAVTVVSGVVTLPNGAEAYTIVAAAGYVAPFMSAKLAFAAQMGTPLAQRKRIDHLGLVLFDTHSQGLQFGQRFDVLDAMPLYEAGAETDDIVWSEYERPVIELPGEWDTDARLCLLAQAPSPCTVGAAIVSVTTHEK